MGFLLTNDDKGCVVYRKDAVSKNGKAYTTYCTKVSNKDEAGNWTSAFINIRFKKDVQVNNKAKIKIKNSFPTLNTYNDNTTITWMIMDFDVLEAGENSEPVSLDGGVDSFMSIPEGIESEVPFN